MQGIEGGSESEKKMDYGVLVGIKGVKVLFFMLQRTGWEKASIE